MYDRIPPTIPDAKKDDKSDAKKIEIVKIFNSNKIIPDIRKDTNTVCTLYHRANNVKAMDYNKG